jgi:hypothetical protein
VLLVDNVCLVTKQWFDSTGTYWEVTHQLCLMVTPYPHHIMNQQVITDRSIQESDKRLIYQGVPNHSNDLATLCCVGRLVPKDGGMHFTTTPDSEAVR